MSEPVYATVDSCNSLARTLALNLWRMFQFPELTEVVRQKVDRKFIDLLNKIRVRNVDEDVQRQVRERFVEESDINYQKNALHMLAENYPAVKHNRKILGKLPSKIFPLIVNILKV